MHNHGRRLPALAGLCFRTRKLWLEKRKPLVGSKDQIVPRAFSPTQIPSTSTSTLKQRRCKYTVRLSDSSKMSVTLHTNLGDIKIEVFCESVPKTAEVSALPPPYLLETCQIYQLLELPCPLRLGLLRWLSLPSPHTALHDPNWSSSLSTKRRRLYLGRTL